MSSKRFLFGAVLAFAAWRRSWACSVKARGD